MPMYFPDLKSVRELAINMATKQKPEKQYKGIIPEKDEDLLEARKQLAEYLRVVWKDEVFAMEVELSVDKDNYDKKMQEAVLKKLKINPVGPEGSRSVGPVLDL